MDLMARQHLQQGTYDIWYDYFARTNSGEVLQWVRLSVHKHVSQTTSATFTKYFVHVAYGCGSDLLWRGDAIPKGRGNFGVFFLTDIALYGPYSGMNFAMKDRLASIYLFTVKLARIQFQILKWHNCDYFEINRKETNTGMEKFDD